MSDIENKKIKIPGRLIPATTEGVVVGTDVIIDESTDIGDGKITHTQQELNEFFAESIDTIVIGGVTVNFSASPTTILVGVQRAISLSANTNIEATNIKFKRDSIEIVSGSGLTLSYSDSITPVTAGNISYLAEFLFGETKKTVSKNVVAVYPIKYGAGNDYTDAVNQASARTSPAGTYAITVQNDRDYVFFVLPASMYISNATLSGFDFPFQPPVNVLVDGIAYKYYKSRNTYDRGILTIIIS